MAVWAGVERGAMVGVEAGGVVAGLQRGAVVGAQSGAVRMYNNMDSGGLVTGVLVALVAIVAIFVVAKVDMKEFLAFLFLSLCAILVFLILRDRITRQQTEDVKVPDQIPLPLESLESLDPSEQSPVQKLSQDVGNQSGEDRIHQLVEESTRALWGNFPSTN